MANERSVQLLSFIPGSGAFAQKSLAQDLKNCSSVFTMVIRKHWEANLLKANQGEQHVDCNGAAAHSASELIENFVPILQQNQKSCSKFSINSNSSVTNH